MLAGFSSAKYANASRSGKCETRFVFGSSSFGTSRASLMYDWATRSETEQLSRSQGIHCSCSTCAFAWMSNSPARRACSTAVCACCSASACSRLISVAISFNATTSGSSGVLTTLRLGAFIGRASRYHRADAIGLRYGFGGKEGAGVECAVPTDDSCILRRPLPIPVGEGSSFLVLLFMRRRSRPAVGRALRP